MNLKEKDDANQAVIMQLVEKHLVAGKEIFKGYVDDPRNTDNAWMETVCLKFPRTDLVHTLSCKTT
jgi:ADP-ribose pyrophosphatase